MGPDDDDDKSFENSGEQFQNDLNDLYGEPEDDQKEE